jgi:hypothetical protein
MRGVPNRSEFIRTAILAALDSRCPLCRGTGVLTRDQHEHWEAFAEKHSVTECDDCHAFHLVCEAGPAKAKRRGYATAAPRGRAAR